MTDIQKIRDYVKKLHSDRDAQIAKVGEAGASFEIVRSHGAQLVLNQIELEQLDAARDPLPVVATALGLPADSTLDAVVVRAQTVA